MIRSLSQDKLSWGHNQEKDSYIEVPDHQAKPKLPNREIRKIVVRLLQDINKEALSTSRGTLQIHQL